MTQAISNDKIPTPGPDRRAPQAKTGSGPHDGAAATARNAAPPQQAADVERASHLFASQRAAAAPTTRLSDATTALALARRLGAAMQADPAAAVAAYGKLQPPATEAALAAPAT